MTNHLSHKISNVNNKPGAAYEHEGAVSQISVIFERVERRKRGRFFVSQLGCRFVRGVVKLPKHRSVK